MLCMELCVDWGRPCGSCERGDCRSCVSWWLLLYGMCGGCEGGLWNTSRRSLVAGMRQYRQISVRRHKTLSFKHCHKKWNIGLPQRSNWKTIRCLYEQYVPVRTQIFNFRCKTNCCICTVCCYSKLALLNERRPYSCVSSKIARTLQESGDLRDMNMTYNHINITRTINHI